MIPTSVASASHSTTSTVTHIGTGGITMPCLTTATIGIPSHIFSPSLPFPQSTLMTPTLSPSIISTSFTPCPSPTLPDTRPRPKHVLSFYGKGLFLLIMYLKHAAF